MPPKKRTKAREQFNQHVFVSKAAADRYIEYNQKRMAIPERGLHVPGPINTEIARRNWEKLCAQPEPAILPLVLEFYANAKEKGVTDTVFVRGKQVCFSGSVINQFYGLDEPDETFEFYDFLNHHVDWTEVINSLCKAETTWKCTKSGDVSVFPTKQLAAFPRAWFYFISATLMPASHLSSVHRNRAALIYAIINEIPVNVGKVVNEAISYCIKDESLAFVCPNLITGLCQAAGVPWSVNEPLLPEKGSFDSKAFYSMKDSQSGFGSNEDYEQPPPPPTRKSMGQRQEQLEKMVKDHIEEFDIFKTDFLAHQRRMEELFEYQRQTNEVLHQTLIGVAQRQGQNSSLLSDLPPFPSKETNTGAGS